MPRKSQLSAPLYFQMCFHAVHPSKNPKDENRGDLNLDYSDSRDGQYVCWSLSQQNASWSSPERRQKHGHSRHLAGTIGFEERLDRRSLQEISKNDQEQRHNARCWLLLFLRQFQRKKAQWCRACSLQPTQWPSCHGAPFHKLRLSLRVWLLFIRLELKTSQKGNIKCWNASFWACIIACPRLFNMFESVTLCSINESASEIGIV